MPRNNSPRTAAKKAKNSPRNPGLISYGIGKICLSLKGYTVKLKEGFMLGWVLRYFDDTKSAYISPFLDKINNNHESHIILSNIKLLFKQKRI